MNGFRPITALTSDFRPGPFRVGDIATPESLRSCPGASRASIVAG